MKKFIILIIIGVLGFILVDANKPPKKATASTEVIGKATDLVNKAGKTISTRVNVPDSYSRVDYPAGSFESYLRHYKLKPFNAKIINYDKTEYFWQEGHIGILEVPVPSNGLQQCADALIRIRTEYLWDADRKEDIGFNFTSGHYCSWLNYAEGYRPKIQGNQVSFYKTEAADHSKDNLYRYLDLIYMYSGTLSLSNELNPAMAGDLQLGDMLIKGGSPGHIVILCDEVINTKGEKLFLLCQGNTPAQSVHLVKNLEDQNLTPWYRLTDDAVVPVSNYTFSSAKFVRFK